MQHGDGELDDSGAVARAVDFGAEVRDARCFGYLVEVVVDAETEACCDERGELEEKEGQWARLLTWRP